MAILLAHVASGPPSVPSPCTNVVPRDIIELLVNAACDADCKKIAWALCPETELTSKTWLDAIRGEVAPWIFIPYASWVEVTPATTLFISTKLCIGSEVLAEDARIPTPSTIELFVLITWLPTMFALSPDAKMPKYAAPSI